MECITKSRAAIKRVGITDAAQLSFLWCERKINQNFYAHFLFLAVLFIKFLWDAAREEVKEIAVGFLYCVVNFADRCVYGEVLFLWQIEFK